jgi:steroid delta-isomerase-like uncharacterized protein
MLEINDPTAKRSTCSDHIVNQQVRPLSTLPCHRFQAWPQNFETMKHAFPDVQAHIEDIVAAQNKVAVRLRLRGTHRGEFLGIPPTGRTIEYVSHEFYRIADGLIAEEWICSDTTTLLRQLS